MISGMMGFLLIPRIRDRCVSHVNIFDFFDKWRRSKRSHHHDGESLSAFEEVLYVVVWILSIMEFERPEWRYQSFSKEFIHSFHITIV